MHDRCRCHSASLAFLVGLSSGLGAVSVQACSSEPYIGSICVTAADYCPQEYLRADGTVYQIRTYQALYAVLGPRYGGDGVNTFAVPDLRGRTMVGTGTGVNPPLAPVGLADRTGAENVTLALANLAPHTHAATYTGGAASGTLALPLTGTSISGQAIGGNIVVNALNGENSPPGGVNIPDSAHNTAGKTGGTANFYSPSATKPVAVPASYNLTVSGGTVAGNASGPASLSVSGGTVAVSTVPNASAAVPFSVINPRLGLTTCIAVNGLYPPRP
jgi:microcystin-dependent protein